MHKFFIFSLIISLICINLSCSSSGQETKKTGTTSQIEQFSGTLYVVGNEPFVKLHLSADNGRNYQINADSSLIKQLWQLQGRHVRISGNEHQSQLGNTLYAKEFQIIQ
jgi:hypothetical protein